MVVYADILIVLNLIVDYFLLSLAGGLLRRKNRLLRMIFSALIGGVFSLYIFLPQSNPIIEFALRLTVCSVMTLTAFGFINLKEYLKVSGVFFGVTCLYAGIMTALWKILKPHGMVINNSVVYFDISAVTLIVCTVIFYFGFMLLSRLFTSNSTTAQNCTVVLSADGREVRFNAILDTGNSVSDVFGNSEIIIADKSVAISLFDNIDININTALNSRYRIIPLSTVSGVDMLDGFRCDSMTATLNKETVRLKNPVLAVSKTAFDSGYSAILNPKIFRNVGEENVPKNKKAIK